MTTALALPKTIAKAVTPPPTKAELIEALALRKIALIEKEKAERWEKIPIEKLALEKAVSDWFAANSSRLKPSVNLGFVCGREDKDKRITNVSVSFEIDNLPVELKKKLIAFDILKSTHISVPSLWEVKKDIREEMAGIMPNRVATMLKDEGTVKALDKMLTQLSGQAAVTV